MSSYDTWHNLLSGISQGSFDKIYVKGSNGAMTDILTLLAGAGGTVTSATLPLSINSGTLSLDLSGFCTSASTPLSLTGGQMTIDLTSYSTTAQMNAAIAAALAPYVLTTWILFHYSPNEHCNHKRSRNLRHQHSADKCIGSLYRHNYPKHPPGSQTKYIDSGDWDLYHRGYHLFDPRTHHLTTGRVDTNGGHNVEFCRQQREFCQRAEHVCQCVFKGLGQILD